METATTNSLLENVLLVARHLSVCPEEARPALLHLAVRAALHPSLRPYLVDPLRPLDGQFPSLDAHLEGILEYAAARRIEAALMAGLSEEDRRILGAGGVHVPVETKSVIGALSGALFVGHSGAAIPCRVFAAYLPDSTDIRGQSAAWAAPIAVRPVSDEVLSSAQAAFAAALWTIEHEVDLPAPLWPAPLYFDAVVPGPGKADLQQTSGDSLGLPLALAFLSALLSAPLRSDIAATGAVGKSPRHPAAITDVGWVREKAAALRGSVHSFLAPAAVADAALPVTPVTSLRDAARCAAPGVPTLRCVRSQRRPRKIAPPTGVVTFLFMEISDAAQLWESAPVAMRQASEAHDRLVEQSILRHHGYIFRRGGEGFCAAFGAAEDACRAALSVQRSLHAHLWPDGTGPLGVRIGVHAGRPDFYRGDYSGSPIHHTNRLMSAAHGGQILLSETVADALLDPPPENWQIDPLGTHRLRDLSEPMALFQLSCPPLPADFPPPQTLEQRRHNLPVQPTSLVARETEVAMLSGLLRGASETRLVTLTGPGGVGKTRLALQSTAMQINSFPDGVWFVSLAAARTAADVAAAVRQTLGLKDVGDPAAAVARALRTSRTLLVLDNFETALPRGAAFVSDLLREAPHVVCLATSRALLQVRGEQRFEVPPLAVPPDDAPMEDIRTSGAVALFCDRVREADFPWTPSDEDVRLMLSICRRLDGLPLAIELAAARLRNFSLQELAARLSDDLGLLSTRLQDVPERHRTLVSTLEWSYGLLDAPERRLFARLSVFAGGFDGEAAEAVGEDPDTRELLESLCDKSLVVRQREGDSRRFTLLSLISDFARRKLEESGQAEATRGAHADFYAALAEREGSAAHGAREVAAFDILDREMNNLRAAVEWLSRARPEALPLLMNAISEFLRRRGHWRERVQWLSTAIAAAAPAAALKRRLLYLHASALSDYGTSEASRAAFWSALEMAREAQDHRLTVDALNQLGLVLTTKGRMGEADALHADALHQEALELSRREGYDMGLALSLSSLGYMAFFERDYAAARLYYTEGMELWRSLGNQRQLVIALTNLACIHDAEGDYARARPLFADCLQCFRDLKDYEGIAMSLANLGEMTERCGDIEAAVPLLLAAERLLSDLGHGYHEKVVAMLARCELPYGLDRLRALRQDFSRRSAQDLRQIETQERWLPIRAVEKIPVAQANPSARPGAVYDQGE